MSWFKRQAADKPGHIVPAQALERAVQPWLFVVVVLTTGPHMLHQPLWLSALVGTVLAGVIAAWWQARPLLHRNWLFLLVAIATGGVLWQYKTLFGRDAGVSLMQLLLVLKLLELKARRDALVVILLGYFLLLTHYFYSQSIPTGLMLLLAMLAVTAALIRLHSGPLCTPKTTFRLAGSLTLQAIPFMLVLYLLFPRISGPLWGMPQEANSGTTGLSDQMSPGSFGKLVENSSIAFRAQFQGNPPPKNLLYWRGPVLEDYNGKSWHPSPTPHRIPDLQLASDRLYDYTITLEPHQQRWLLALDAPIRIPAEAEYALTLEVKHKQPVHERQRFSFRSGTHFIFNQVEVQEVLQLNLSLPANLNPRTLALSRQWRQQLATPEKVMEQALDLFHKENFVYTLRPPLLGQDAMDDFLFGARRGFCEHYASAFVVLMRGAGIPARVVTGYQGGEINPVDGFVVVRQSDAHAWAEVWLAGRGWVRVDPTAAIAPERIERGIRAALPAGETLPGLLQVNNNLLRTLRHRWEAVNNGWNQWVLGYTPERQQEVLRQLGLHDPDWKSMVQWLAILCGLLLAGGTLFLFWQQRQRARPDPALQLWQQALRHLARQQLAPEAGETPHAFVQRLKSLPTAPAQLPLLEVIVQALYALRYDPPGSAAAQNTPLNTLKRAVYQLTRQG